MDLTSARAAAMPTGRRRESRLRVRLDAEVITLDGQVCGVMADISSSGARVEARGLSMRPGQEMVLRWCGREAFGMVAWVAGGQCGITFYDPIAGRDLIELRRLDDAQDRRDADRRAVRTAAQAFVQGKVRL